MRPDITRGIKKDFLNASRLENFLSCNVPLPIQFPPYGPMDRVFDRGREAVKRVLKLDHGIAQHQP